MRRGVGGHILIKDPQTGGSLKGKTQNTTWKVASFFYQATGLPPACLRQGAAGGTRTHTPFGGGRF